MESSTPVTVAVLIEFAIASKIKELEDKYETKVGSCPVELLLRMILEPKGLKMEVK